MKYRNVNVVGFHVKYMYDHSIQFYLSLPVILYSNKNSVPYVTQNTYIVRE